jgi:hypothetical protein
MVEIEGVFGQKQLDLLNKVKLFEAVQGPCEFIRNFIHRLQILAYECTFTTSCSGFGGVCLGNSAVFVM